MANQYQSYAGGSPGLQRRGRTIVVGIFVLMLVFTIVLVILSIPAGVYAVFSNRLSQVSWTSLGHPYLWVGPVFETLPFITISAGYWFLLLTGAYCLFLGIAVWQRQRPVSAIRSSFRQGVSSLMSSPFLVVIIGTGFLSFSAYLIDNIVASTGTGIGGPIGDPLNIFVGFTTAPLVEEFGFRMLLIGVVALILSIGRPWRDALGALWRPSRALEGFAVGTGGTIILWAATAFSAVTFGACHVFCGTTWDIGKFPEAAFGGLVLGVLYVKYGFHVAVLVHWGIDYFGSAYAFFGQAAYGIPWTSATTEFTGQLAVDVDLVLTFGLACFVLVAYMAVRWVGRRRLTATGEFDKGLPGGGPAEP